MLLQVLGDLEVRLSHQNVQLKALKQSTQWGHCFIFQLELTTGRFLTAQKIKEEFCHLFGCGPSQGSPEMSKVIIEPGKGL